MAYQALARKWRPNTFTELAGQEHVLKALVNGLDHERLHHAYLFTGTRGVGKTTIARIFAKCLNCETGVSSAPCGQCSTCLEVTAGRFVDLIEVDAASRTKVEDTRELLENVQYAPTKGRYKVYLIDEVHMLSGHSFNALLKTLEEPPPHVKFLLATTDPQKLPPTILSRCLQFSLKNMTPELIVRHLAKVLDSEVIAFEEPALWHLGRAARGSMRDALSLTDQAIAFGSGKVREDDVCSMLGTVQSADLLGMLTCLLSNDTGGLLQRVANMDEHAPDYQAAIDGILGLLHKLTLAQVAPEALDNSEGNREQLLAMAQQASMPDVQLFYQLALHGRRDLPLAPSAREGFEMLLLRMLAMRPLDAAVPAGSSSSGGAAEKKSEASVTAAVNVEPVNTASSSPVRSASGILQSLQNAEPVENTVKVAESAPETPPVPEPEPVPAVAQKAFDVGTVSDTRPAVEREHAPCDDADFVGLEGLNAETWLQVFTLLPLSGVARSIASQLAFVSRVDGQLNFLLDKDNASLFNENYIARVKDSLSQYWQCDLSVNIDIGNPPHDTPAMRLIAEQKQRQAEAEQAIANDPWVQKMLNDFAGRIVPGSIEPIKH